MELQYDDMTDLVKNIISSLPHISADANDFVNDLYTAVPIFIKEGATIRWSHKSLMEYFAALCICRDLKEKQKDVMVAMFNSNNMVAYINVIEMCAEIDFFSFRNAILNDVLEEYISEFNRIKNSNADFKESEAWHKVTFGREICIYHKRIENFNDIDLLFKKTASYPFPENMLGISLTGTFTPQGRGGYFFKVYENKYRIIIDMAARLFPESFSGKPPSENNGKSESPYSAELAHEGWKELQQYVENDPDWGQQYRVCSGGSYSSELKVLNLFTDHNEIGIDNAKEKLDRAKAETNELTNFIEQFSL